jgi:hypothetical protein
MIEEEGALEDVKGEEMTSGFGRYFVKAQEEAGGFVEVLVTDGRVS